MEYQSKIIKGFQSVFYFKCKVCNIVEKLYTENNKKNRHSNNQQCCCQCVSSYRYWIYPIPVISDSAWEEMRKAGEEEKELALKCGNVDTDGIPMCTVVADGQWSKRSYKTNYNASSGVVSLFTKF
ncbi:unnamed protein product [Macrosiphum euphorbiae]|uniref:Mutator-like transposase domain-containing protein n=1 Tax=Macrosiphum euphorbiae TaxID=13131 RepID=A0AAV0Y8P3_9HEMI|nr:unnamed protein product [Macrosiphum euphorbiae]